jgi:hypothetical protein
MAFAVKGTGDTALFNTMPVFALASLFNRFLKGDAITAPQDDDVRLSELISTLQYDIKIVVNSAGLLESCANLKSKVLLLGGSKSKGYLKRSLVELKKRLPEATYVVFKGQGHIAADNNGNPGLVSEELSKFFKD